MIFGILVFLCGGSAFATGRCTKYLRATHRTNYIYTDKLSSAEKCEWVIRPYRSLDHYEYLEISWIRFITSSASSMPKCETDNVEVLITNKRYSVGKFCGGGMHGLPFKISSIDGYATIRYSLGLSYGAYLKLSYRIKAVSNTPRCKNELFGKTAFAATFSSSGWPERIDGDCSFKMLSQKDMIARIVVMDFDISNSWGSPCTASVDYVQITASKSNKKGEGHVDVLKPSCGTRRPFILETKLSNIEIIISADNHFTYGRGFHAGILVYSGEHGEGSHGQMTAAAIGGIVFACIIGILLAIIIVCCILRCRSKRLARERNNNQSRSVPMAFTNQVAIHPTVPPLFDAPPPYEWKPDEQANNVPPPRYDDVVSSPGYVPPPDNPAPEATAPPAIAENAQGSQQVEGAQSSSP